MSFKVGDILIGNEFNTHTLTNKYNPVKVVLILDDDLILVTPIGASETLVSPQNLPLGYGPNDDSVRGPFTVRIDRFMLYTSASKVKPLPVNFIGKKCEYKSVCKLSK